MKISDLFRRDANNVRTVGKDEAELKKAVDAEKNPTRANDDTINISSKARQFRQISTILSEDESSRAQRVEELKQKVANGTYAPSSSDVATSIVNYLSEKNG